MSSDSTHKPAGSPASSGGQFTVGARAEPTGVELALEQGGVDDRDLTSPSYSPVAALTDCFGSWGSGSWPEGSASANLDEVMAHVERLLEQQKAAVPDQFGDSRPESGLDGVELTTWVASGPDSRGDGAKVIQIDTDEGAGRIRIRLNDEPVWDGDPELEVGTVEGDHPHDMPSPEADALGQIAGMLSDSDAEGDVQGPFHEEVRTLLARLRPLD